MQRRHCLRLVSPPVSSQIRPLSSPIVAAALRRRSPVARPPCSHPSRPHPPPSAGPAAAPVASSPAAPNPSSHSKGRHILSLPLRRNATAGRPRLSRPVARRSHLPVRTPTPHPHDFSRSPASSAMDCSSHDKDDKLQLHMARMTTHCYPPRPRSR